MKSLVKPSEGFRRAILEIYMLFKDSKNNRIFTILSGYLGRKDASKLSRQINPTDESRDNPYAEVLEIQWALVQYSPELEAATWSILEHERSKFIPADNSEKRKADLMTEICTQVGKIAGMTSLRVPAEEMEKEAFLLTQNVQSFYEQIKVSSSKG